MDTRRDFNGDTWVAFADLCGTKAMYARPPKPWRAKQAEDTGAGSFREICHEGTR